MLLSKMVAPESASNPAVNSNTQGRGHLSPLHGWKGGLGVQKHDRWGSRIKNHPDPHKPFQGERAPHTKPCCRAKNLKAKPDLQRTV